MADMEITYRQWTVQARLADGEAPDMAKNYTNITMRPYAVTLRFDARGGQPDLSLATVHGHRVNKDGLGTTVAADYYRTSDSPEWLVSLISEAQTLVFRDAGAGGF